MRKLPFLLTEVRESTDMKDSNSITDKEIIRYFNEGIKAVQAIAYGNDVLCSYFQDFMEINETPYGKEFDLPPNCYGHNAVTYVESSTYGDKWRMVERVWQEDASSFYGWFTRNKKIIFSGCKDGGSDSKARVWYFKSIPRWDKTYGVLGTPAGNVFTPTRFDREIAAYDDRVSIFRGTELIGIAEVVASTESTITLDLNGLSVLPTDTLVSGVGAKLEVELPVEIEPFLLSYVSQRIFNRGTYTNEASTMDFFTSAQRRDITSIFANAGKAITRTPYTDTSFLEL